MENNPFEYEKEIDEIRAKLYQEYLAMTQEEWNRKISDTAYEAAQKYGFMITPSRSIKRSGV